MRPSLRFSPLACFREFEAFRSLAIKLLKARRTSAPRTAAHSPKALLELSRGTESECGALGFSRVFTQPRR